jgi:hypothetical protein
MSCGPEKRLTETILNRSAFPLQPSVRVFLKRERLRHIAITSYLYVAVSRDLGPFKARCRGR